MLAARLNELHDSTDGESLIGCKGVFLIDQEDRIRAPRLALAIHPIRYSAGRKRDGPRVRRPLEGMREGDRSLNGKYRDFLRLAIIQQRKSA